MSTKLASGWAVALMLATGPGCEMVSKTTNASATESFGPHGGVAVALPADRGYGEVVIEPAPAGRKQQPSAQVAVYFLKPDLATPLDALPADVSVRLQLPDKDAETVALVPEPKAKAKDPASAGRFASPPGPYTVDRTIGELSGKLGDQSFTVPFASPH